MTKGIFRVVVMMSLALGCGENGGPDLNNASVDTALDRSTVTLGEAVTITCSPNDRNGAPINVETNVVVDPDPGQAVADHVLTTAAVGTFQVACRIRDSFIVDHSPATLTVTAGTPTQTKVVLSSNEAAANAIVYASCMVQDKYGNDIQGLATQIDAVEDLTISGQNISATRAGTYLVTCSITDFDAPLDRTPASLVVIPAAPASLEIVATPDKSRYLINDTVELSFVVKDAFENDVLGVMASWTTPGNGVNVSPAGIGLTVTFLQEGAYTFHAALADTSTISGTRALYCDTNPPNLVIQTPVRGATLQGNDYVSHPVIVTGTVTDNASGLQSLLINGSLAEVNENGSFTVSLAPHHGMNMIKAEATDRAGLVQTRAQGFYYSTAYVPFTDRPDHEGEWVADGLTAFIGQDTLDDMTRSCAFSNDIPPKYTCQPTGQDSAYDDVATVLEVVLNNLDLSSLADMGLFDSGLNNMIEQNLTPTPVDIDLDYLTGGMLPYRIRGVLVLTGTYQVTATILTLDWGVIHMGDPAIDEVGLTAREGGMDLVAYLTPAPDKTKGLSTSLALNVQLQFAVGFSIDSKWNKSGTLANGLYEKNGDNWSDISSEACGGIGTLAMIDSGWQLAFGSNPNFSGYVCEQDAMAANNPIVNSGATLSADKIKVSADIDLGMDQDDKVDVTVTNVAADFLGGAVDVNTIEPVSVDLSDVVVFGGIIDIEDYVPGASSFQITNFQPFLAEFLSEAFTAFQSLMTPVLNDLFVCGGALECALDVSTFLESAIESVAIHGQAVTLLPLSAGIAPVQGDFASHVELLQITNNGMLMKLDTVLEAPHNADLVPYEPLGSILRENCGTGADPFLMPMTHSMEAALHFDLINQAIHAFWWAGGLSTTLDFDAYDLPADVTALSVRTEPMLPPILTDCVETTRGAHLQIADLRLDANMTINGEQISMIAYLQADLETGVEAVEGRVVFDINPEPTALALDITYLSGDLGGQEEAIETVLQSQILKMLVNQGALTGIMGVPLPAIDLDAMAIPGMPEGLDIHTQINAATIAHGRILIQPTL